jgi:hypothetical protein
MINAKNEIEVTFKIRVSDTTAQLIKLLDGFDCYLYEELNDQAQDALERYVGKDLNDFVRQRTVDTLAMMDEMAEDNR